MFFLPPSVLSDSVSRDYGQVNNDGLLPHTESFSSLYHICEEKRWGSVAALCGCSLASHILGMVYDIPTDVAQRESEFDRFTAIKQKPNHGGKHKRFCSTIQTIHNFKVVGCPSSHPVKRKPGATWWNQETSWSPVGVIKIPPLEWFGGLCGPAAQLTDYPTDTLMQARLITWPLWRGFLNTFQARTQRPPSLISPDPFCQPCLFIPVVTTKWCWNGDGFQKGDISWRFPFFRVDKQR